MLVGPTPTNRVSVQVTYCEHLGGVAVVGNRPFAADVLTYRSWKHTGGGNSMIDGCAPLTVSVSHHSEPANTMQHPGSG